MSGDISRRGNWKCFPPYKLCTVDASALNFNLQNNFFFACFDDSSPSRLIFMHTSIFLKSLLGSLVELSFLLDVSFINLHLLTFYPFLQFDTVILCILDLSLVIATFSSMCHSQMTYQRNVIQGTCEPTYMLIRRNYFN